MPKPLVVALVFDRDIKLVGCDDTYATEVLLAQQSTTWVTSQLFGTYGIAARCFSVKISGVSLSNKYQTIKKPPTIPAVSNVTVLSLGDALSGRAFACGNRFSVSAKSELCD